MSVDPIRCCDVVPKGAYDVKLEKWFFSCPVCGRCTNGHSARKKAVEAWNKGIAIGSAGGRFSR